MNILTADTGYLAADPGWFQQGSAQYRFDTNSSSHVGRLQTRFGDGKNWGASLGLTGKNFGDIRDSGVGRMKNTGYPEQNLDLKVETLLNPSTRLSFAHQYLNQDNVWRWHSTIYNDTPWNNTSTGSYAARIYDQERSLTYLKVTGDLLDSPVQNYSATLSFQRSQDSAFQDRSATDVRTQVIDVDTIGLDVQLESDLLGGDLVYGIDYYRDSIESGGTRTGRDPRSRRPVADDSTYHLLGAFAQLRKPLNQRLETTFGARITPRGSRAW